MFLLLFLIVTGCEKDDYAFVLPEKYFPAYPTSHWIYSNGTTVHVDPEYYLHQYKEELSSSKTTEPKYVPRIDGHYVYGYKITQNSNRIPLKELLRTSTGTWDVDFWEGIKIRRRLEKIDTIVLRQNVMPLDTNVVDTVVFIVEFFENNPTNWISREAYAPNIGLIRRELNMSDTSINPFIEKELIYYFISK